MRQYTLNDPDSRDHARGWPQPPPDVLEVLNLRYYFAVIRERSLMAGATALLVCIALAAILLNQPPVYESQALLVVDRDADRIVDIPEVVQTGLGGGWSSTDQTNVLLQTHVGELGNRRFIEDFVQGMSSRELTSVLAPDDSTGHLQTEERHFQEERAVRLILSNLQVRRIPDTLMLEVRFVHGDPAVAADVANGLASLFIQQAKDRRLDGHTRATGFLTTQADKLRFRVEELEREAQQYREEHNLVSLQENQNIVAQRVADVSSALTDVSLTRVSVETTLQKVDELISAGADPRELASFPGFASLQISSDELDALRSERERLAKRYLRNHPQMQENQEAIEGMERTIRSNLVKALNDLRNQHGALSARERELKRELADAEQRSLELDRHAATYRLVQGKVESARATHAQVLNRLQETSLAAQVENTNLRVTQSAIPPRTPSSPRLSRVLIIVGFVGGIVFVGLPIGINALDTRLRDTGDVESFLQRPLLGEIPAVPRRIASGETRLIGDASQGAAPVVEAFRAIYSYLSLGNGNGHSIKGGLVTAVVGSMQGEGKTFAVANIARTFAAHGTRTLLIDCDLRGPSIGGIFNVKNAVGLEAYLQGDSSDESAFPVLIQVSDSLSLLTANRPVSNATELLAGPRFAELIERCRKQFDLILLDTPPLKVFPDALSIIRHVDEVVFLCEFGRVDRNILKRLIQSVERVHDRPVSGVVINKMPAGSNALHCYSLKGYYGDRDYNKYYDRKETNG